MEFTKWQLELLSILVQEKVQVAYELGNRLEYVEIGNKLYKSFPDGIGDEDNLKALKDKLDKALQEVHR